MCQPRSGRRGAGRADHGAIVFRLVVWAQRAVVPARARAMLRFCLARRAAGTPWRRSGRWALGGELMNSKGSALGWAAAIAMAVGGLAGCGPGEPEPEAPVNDAERCVGEEGNGEPLSAREVLLGKGSGAAFQAYAEGEEAELIAGFQGGYMITPTVRVEAAGDMRAEACFRVWLQNTIVEGAEVGPGTLSYVVFTRSGDFFDVESLFDLLGFEADALSGKTLLLKAKVSGVGFTGEREVTLRLK